MVRTNFFVIPAFTTVAGLFFLSYSVCQYRSTFFQYFLSASFPNFFLKSLNRYVFLKFLTRGLVEREVVREVGEGFEDFDFFVCTGFFERTVVFFSLGNFICFCFGVLLLLFGFWLALLPLLLEVAEVMLFAELFFLAMIYYRGTLPAKQAYVLKITHDGNYTKMIF